MEQLQLLNYIIVAIVISCVGYSAFSFIGWVFSLFGGLCIGCNA